MRQIKAAIAGILSLLAAATASAQTFPTVPPNTFIGRTGIGAGPSQAIPFASFLPLSGFVTLPVVSGDVSIFDGTTGKVKDSGASGLFSAPASYPVVVNSGGYFCPLSADCQYGNRYSQYPLGSVSTNPLLIGKAGNTIGSSTLGQTFKIVFTSAALIASPITITYTAGAAETTSTVATGLCALVNANTTLHGTGGKPIFCQPLGSGVFNLQYDSALSATGATPLTTATTGSTGTINLVAEVDALDFIVMQLGRNATGHTGKAGDALYALDFTGQDSTGTFNTHYGQISITATVATAGATRGTLDFLTAGNSGPLGRVAIKEGIQLRNATGVAPTGGDVGPGTINVPSTGGYYVAGNAFAVNGASYALGGNLFGGTANGATLNLQSTQSGTPSADFVQVTAGGKVGYKFDGVDSTFGTSGTLLGSTSFVNLTSGSIKIQPPTGALGSRVLTLPVATDTLVGKATTDILTNKTFDTAGAGNALSINGVNAATAWSTFTPAAACGTATFTVNSARSKTLGKLTYIQIELTFTALGTCGITNITFNLPNTAQSGGALIGREIATNKGVNCIILASGTTAGCLRTEATTWIAGDHFVASGVYENQ